MFYLHLLSTCGVFFVLFVFFLSAHMQTLNALLHRKGLNVHRVCEVLSLIF